MNLPIPILSALIGVVILFFGRKLFWLCVAAVGGGCLAPVAAHHDGTTLTGLIAAEDGSWIERRTGDDPEALGQELVDASRRHT